MCRVPPWVTAAQSAAGRLATTESGTLRLNDTPDGLHYEADLPNTSAGHDAYELVKTGRVSHSSMGFIAMQDEFRREGTTLVRHLLNVRLTHISPCAQPAYFDTSVAIRSLAGQPGEGPDDVAVLAARGELRSLMMRTDQQVAAPPTVVPSETRSTQNDVQLRQRLLAERERTVHPPVKRDPRQLVVELRRRKMAADEGKPVDEPRTITHGYAAAVLERRRQEMESA